MAESTEEPKPLSLDEVNCLELQNKRLVSEHKAKMLELEARKHWDLFYKRNETRFFRDRHWTTREFTDLLIDHHSQSSGSVMLEVGCGVGNLIFPLIKERLNIFIYACDFSQRAVEFIKNNALYDETYVRAFQADITKYDDLQAVVTNGSIDIITFVFVLSAIHPDKFLHVLKNLFDSLKPGGIVLFRDYGLYDMAQLRFKAGHKIAENFYMRQDGTRSYYFSLEFLNEIFIEAGYEIVTSSYIHRRTVNKKENIDVPRIFVQGKFKKPKEPLISLVNFEINEDACA